MNTYTIAVTDHQQQVLEWMVKQINAEKGLALSVAQFLQGRFGELIGPFDLRYSEWEADEVRKRFRSSDDVAKSEIKTTLGF